MRALLLSLVLLVMLIPASASAVYQCGAQKDTCICGGYDPYPCCSNGGNCTWWAWEAACCNWGISLPGWGNANQWQGNARAHGYDIRDCHTPVVGTIANRLSGTFGHVAWVTNLNGGGGVHVTEQNCDYGPGSMDQMNYGLCYFDGGFIARGGQVQCNPGDSQQQGCGGCGVQSRGCGADGRWGGWSGCSAAGVCSPGQSQTQACGRCGSQVRTCNGGCGWDGWSACTGEGECSPGQVDSMSCCDCGTTQRACNNACHWEDNWSACAGPDPTGDTACATGKAGVCSEGQERCVNGCLACVQAHEASAEVCDGLDNDCNGSVDDGHPRQLGTPIPAYAASIIDASFPRSLAAGTSAEAWVIFRNEGAATWRAGAVSLRADALAAGHTSRLAPPEGWPAYDTAAVLDRDVPPGETASFRFSVQAQSGADIDETFTLVTPELRAMTCPEASVELAIATVGAGAESPSTPKNAAPAVPVAKHAGCGSVEGEFAALLVAMLMVLRRRSGRVRPSH